MTRLDLLPAFVLGSILPALAPAGAFGQCEVQRVLASDGAPGDGFGQTSDMEGDILAIGALGKNVGETLDAGATYVFEWDGTSWIQSLEIVITEPALAIERLGAQVAVSGNRVFSGATRYIDSAGGPNEGLVYVHEKSAGGWRKMATILGRDVGTYGAIGGALAASGDRLVLGVPDNSHSGFQEAGSAYVLEWNGTIWAGVATLRASDPDWHALMGSSVAFDGKTIAVGALGDSSSGSWRSGAVYVFEEQSGVWTQVAKLLPSVPYEEREFGRAVQVDGSTIVVSAKLLADEYPTGAPVYVFDRKHDGSWGPHEDLLLTFDGGQNSIYPRSTSIDGDRLLIGTMHDSGIIDRGGSGQLFERTDQGWRQIAEIAPAGAVEWDFSGISAALDGERVFLGAFGHDVEINEGAGYVYAILDTVRGYCLGDVCPCGNVDSNHRGCVNSTGGGGLLATCGTTSVASDDLVLHASNLPPGCKALPFMGGGQTFAFFGDGTLCVGPGGVGLFRYGPPQNADSAGNLVLGPGIVARSQGFWGAGAIDPGETWNFQVWHRNVFDSPCGGLFNTTNALAVTFVP